MDLNPRTLRGALPRILLVLAPIFAAASFCAYSVGFPMTLSRISASLLTGLLIAALVLPVALLAMRGAERPRRPGAWVALLVATGLLVLTAVATGLPRIGVFAELDNNWQGKLVDLAWIAVLLCVWGRWARERAGVRWRLQPGSLRPVVVVTALFSFTWFALTAVTVLTVGVDGVGAESFGLSTERLLFDTTIPNLSEELIWRGAMLAVLNQAFGTPWRLAGAKVGWGLILTSLAFGVGHGVLVEPGFALQTAPANIVLTGLGGFVMGWVRERTGSLWPAFVCHCAPEVSVLVALWLWFALS